MRSQSIHCCSMNRWSGLEVGDEVARRRTWSLQLSSATFLEGRSKSLNSAQLPHFKNDFVAL
jgi:hypothetical protein